VKVAQEKEAMLKQQILDEEEYAKKKKEKFVPKTNYREKYQHILGNGEDPFSHIKLLRDLVVNEGFL
jgi:hypothetical protein